MGKKDLQGGIANLLSGADQSVTQKRLQNIIEAESREPTSEASSADEEEKTAMSVDPTTTQDERDLLATIEDEELRRELEERLAAKRKKGVGRPRKNDQLGRRSDGYNRTSIIVNEAKWAKIREIAFRETLTMKEIVELAIDRIIASYEDRHGEVTPHPERERP